MSRSECARYSSFATIVALIAGTSHAVADMQRLDEADMADISGQSGITMELEVGMKADRVSYFDDGQGIHLEGFSVSSASDPEAGARHVIKMDVGADASLNLDYLIEDRRVEFSDIRLAGAPGVSMGGVYFDHTLAGILRIAPGGALGGDGYTFDSAYTMTGGRLGYRTNGNEVFLDGIAMDVEALGMTLDVSGDTLLFDAPSITGSYTVDAIRYSNNPLNHGSSADVTSGATLASYGSLEGDFNISSATEIRAGGREGQGLILNNSTTINSANFIYRDDGNALAFRDISGAYELNDLRVDVTQDWQGRDALGLTLGSLSGGLDIGRIELGAVGKSIGSLNVNFLFADQNFNGREYTNAVYLQGGGHADAGPQGLRLATEWSLQRADLSYTDNGNRVIFSGLQSWGQGDTTVNITEAGTIGETEFFDGLRLGFENIEAGYRLNGLKVGSEDAQLQGGTELLLALGVYPAYEFEVDGHITLGAGGASGEGLTINSDIQITNGRAALIAAPYDEGEGEVPQKGLWASDLNYDIHVRAMTVDVTEEGFAIIKGEAWSTMDIGNLRIGDKEAGSSFGRFVVQSYETGSSMEIVPGGAGAACVGGSGSDASACSASGGNWEDRGDEGITIKLKQIFAKAVSETRKNAFIWETNRELTANGKAVNNSGTKLVLNDIYTSDGGDFDGNGIDDNTFGVQTDIAIDVYQTKVVKKKDGPDSLGVIGSRGDEKIMDTSATEGYRYATEPSTTDIENRPLGFAVQARSQFKELAINNVDLVHPTGGAQTAIYGVKLQNFDIKANLSATPIP
ncbi:DUF6160 family protein [Marinobacter salicampi]|uniref:DUF6160 family protein n=1 Tax=Marinobacter salicampi TaxID=435907 RepID=UPI00140957A0|nr:DUF6160 family protein [Marinobacter salicampi]